MNTFAIARLNFFDNVNEVTFVTAPTELDAMKVFAKDYFDSETIDNPELEITDIQDMFFDSDMSVSEPKMIPILTWVYMENYVDFLNRELKERYNFSLLDSNGKYRDTEELVDELSTLFNSLSDEEQNNLCELFLND